MATRIFEENYGRSLELDICETCQGLWFDGTELLQLSPGATLALFRSITNARPVLSKLTDRAPCPRCGATLAAGSDLQGTTRFFFRRCPAGHGRFMTFFQFLRAKRFVRTLRPAEMRQLREQVRQLNCSNCGAPLDIDRSPSCAHCGTPVSIVDPSQLEATVRRLAETDVKRKTPDPALPLKLALERLRTEREFRAIDPATHTASIHEAGGLDLVWTSLTAVTKLFD
jgi:hypothetical protein